MALSSRDEIRFKGALTLYYEMLPTYSFFFPLSSKNRYFKTCTPNSINVTSMAISRKKGAMYDFDFNKYASNKNDRSVG